MSYNQGHITTGNGASFGRGRAGDARNSYNTHRSAQPITGIRTPIDLPIHRQVITRGRNNNNTIHNNKAGPPREDDTEAMEKELERLKALLAQKKARAAEKSKKAKLAQDLAAMRKELEVFEDAEEDLPQYQS
ncbi:hypothetical protein ONZ45_g8304 [Pleurotus djamor]|nr:hypothetical protein ONZ45_g8304 [Pleurotus djamor]